MRWRLTAAVLALLLAAGGAHAQSVSFDLGGTASPGTTGRLVQITALITALSLAPSLLVMVTAFTRIVIVLSLLRSALGAQGTPPNIVLIGLALFLTLFVMQPVMERSWTEGIRPLTEGRIGELDGLARAAEPFRGFMAATARPADLALFERIGKLPPTPVAGPTPGTLGSPPPWRALIPAFLVGELRRAFQMGFLLYLPFVVIDIVVAAVLMSLGMMMLPPGGVSLPFKLIFFVMVDGWSLVAGGLAQSFGTMG